MLQINNDQDRFSFAKTWVNDRLLLRQMEDVIRRSIQVLRALPDKDARFLRFKSGWGAIPDVVHEIQQAYGYDRATVKDTPSAGEISMMEEVMDRLVVLRRMDERDFQRLWRLCSGWTVIKLAAKEHCTSKTMRGRLNRALAKMLRLFGIEIEDVEDPAQEETVKRFFSATGFTSAERAEAMKTWVHGKGFMLGGKSLDNGRGKIRRARQRAKAREAKR